MKKLTFKILLITLACLSPLYSSFTAEASSAPKRNYNCRMPQRGHNTPGPQIGDRYESRYLFDNLGLSPKLYDRLDKSYVKYRRDMEAFARKASSDPRRAEQYRQDAVKRENSFLNEVRRALNSSQYRAFQGRFVSMLPNRPSNSAPRPGSGVGPMMPGPAPTMMTNGR